MKTSILNSITIICLLFISGTVFSQDTIFKKDNSIIICNIQEVTDDVISYKMINNGDVQFKVKTIYINRISFASGTEISYNKEKKTEGAPVNSYVGNKRNAIKMDMFSPLLGVFVLGYERSIKPGSSVEVEVGLIGLGTNVARQDASGISFKAGYKHFKLRSSHILSGLYLRPEFNLAVYNANVYETTSTYGVYGYSTSTKSLKQREQMTAAAFILSVGGQTVINNSFLIDAYVGLGYGMHTNNDINKSFYNYRFMTGENGFPIAFTWGFKMGLPF